MSESLPATAISFIVAAYQVEGLIGATLDSLAAVLREGDELIVVNDGSRDGTGDRVRAHPAALNGRLRLIEQANQGVARTRMAGLAAATCPYVLFFDGDDLLQAGPWARARALLNTLQPDVLLTDYETWWPDPQDLSNPQAGRREPSPPRRHPPRVRLSDAAQTLVETYDDSISALWNRVLRRSLAQEVMTAHCPLWSTYEDLAVTPWLIAAAGSVVYAPEPTVLYRQTGSGLTARRSVAACANLLASALHAAAARHTLASPIAASAAAIAAAARGQAPNDPALHDAALRMLARKLADAVRAFRQTGGSAAQLHQQVLVPALVELGPAWPAIADQLCATGRPGDRGTGRLLRRIARTPRLYAALQALGMRLRKV